MTRAYCFPLLFASLLCSCAAAAVHERDWKTSGDGLLTYDDVHRREWLDISVSSLNQFAGSTRMERIESAVAEIAPGGRFDGFTFAKRKDVIRLAQSAGIDTGTTNLLVNQDPTTDLIDLLGITFHQSSSVAAIGFIDEQNVAPPFPISQFAAEFMVRTSSPSTGVAGIFITSNDDRLSAPLNGLMLYRIVPEPSSFFVAVSFSALVSLMRLRNSKRT